MRMNNKLAIFFLFSTFLLLVYFLVQVERKVDIYIKNHEDVNSIILINKELDIFIKTKIEYANFDDVEKNIKDLRKRMSAILGDNFFHLSDNSVKEKLNNINFLIGKKIYYLQRIKSTKAVMNNSFRYIQDIFIEQKSNKNLKLYTTIVTLPYNKEVNAQKQLEHLKVKNNKDPLIKHAKIFFEYYLSYSKTIENINKLLLNKHLSIFSNAFDKNATKLINDFFVMALFVSILFMIMLAFFLLNSYKLYKKQVELDMFKNAVERSDNIVLITDKYKNITYVNSTFEKSTGYTLEEVKGKKPSIFKGNTKDDSFYKKLNEEIYSGRTWKGEFINKNREGELVYEKASITPILNEKGKVEEFLAIKLDITEEIHTQRRLKEKEYLLSQQAKMIAMGEMLESIAHQWRQPLSTISTAASGLKLNKEYRNLSDDQFNDYTNIIIKSSNYLSSVIDNFKDFFKTDNTNTIFVLENTIKKVIDLVGYKLNAEKIEYILDIKEIKCIGLENELVQAISNILNNSKDAFSKSTVKKYIFVTIKKDLNKMALISIKDNAGGMKKEVLEHVFEPYFTTKHKSQGTGLGLYSTYEIIVKHFNGTIEVKNTNYSYENKKYKGCEVLIKIPFSE